MNEDIDLPLAEGFQGQHHVAQAAAMNGEAACRTACYGLSRLKQKHHLDRISMNHCVRL